MSKKEEKRKELESIEKLNLSTRIQNALMRGKIETVASLMNSIDSDKINQIRCIGEKSVEEIINRLKDYIGYEKSEPVFDLEIISQFREQDPYLDRHKLITNFIITDKFGISYTGHHDTSKTYSGITFVDKDPGFTNMDILSKLNSKIG